MGNSLSECARPSVALGETHRRMASIIAWMDLQAGEPQPVGQCVGVAGREALTLPPFGFCCGFSSMDWDL